MSDEPTDERARSLTLRTSRVKWLLVAIIGLAFTAAGIWLVILDKGAMSWVVIVFFGLSLLVALYQILWPGELRLERDAFEFSALGRTTRLAWTDAGAFGVASIRAKRLVVFDLAVSGTVAAINRRLGGASHALPDTYGMRAEDLVALMNEWRDRALSSHSATDGG